MFVFISLLISLLLSPLAVGYSLLVWFDGAIAFVEYCNLLKISKFIPSLQKFNIAVSNGYSGSYLDYLEAGYSDRFVTRLITCEKCIAFWFALLLTGPGLIYLICNSWALALVAPILVLGSAYKGYQYYKKIKNG